LELNASQETAVRDTRRGEKDILGFADICLGQNLIDALPQRGMI
jgi:hypothetical protein